MSNSARSPLGDSDHGLGEIEEFFTEIAELSQSNISFGQFASELLERTTEMLAAAGGAVWMRQTHVEMQLQCHLNLEMLDTQAHSATAAAHRNFLQATIQTGKAHSLEPRSVAPHMDATVNASNFIWIACPFRVDEDVVGVVEVLQPPHINSATQHGNEKLLTIVCDLTGDFLRRQQLRELQQAERRWQQYEALVYKVHANLDLRHTAFQLVNEGRPFIGADRVSLIVSRAGNLRLLAISGVDTFDRRSYAVRSLETLAKQVVQTRQPLRYRGASEQLPPQLLEPISAYVDVSHVHAIYVVPLSSPTPVQSSHANELVGVLIVEQFDAVGGAISDEAVNRVANLAKLSLRNALDYDTLPLLSLARLVRRANRQLGTLPSSKLVVATSFMLLVGLALMLIPAQFYVRAQGELQPAARRDIYAPLDGEVIDVRIEHDEDVDQGQVLLVLRSRPLEIELQRLHGEYQTTEKRLFAIASARVQSNADEAFSASYPGQLAAEEQELKQLLVSQQKQIDLLRAQRDQLSVQSPIAGRVLTWNPRELLEDRPVQRGQLLVSTADIHGPWNLELLVPENRIGHVVTAQRAQQKPLEVTFSLATDRSRNYRGLVTQVAARSEIVGERDASVKVIATVPDTALHLLRPGAIVYAKVDCGSKSLGFVWLHEIVETCKARLLF